MSGVANDTVAFTAAFSVFVRVPCTSRGLAAPRRRVVVVALGMHRGSRSPRLLETVLQTSPEGVDVVMCGWQVGHADITGREIDAQ